MAAVACRQTPTRRCTTSRRLMTCPSPTACADRSAWLTASLRTWTSAATCGHQLAVPWWRCSGVTARHCCCASGRSTHAGEQWPLHHGWAASGLQLSSETAGQGLGGSCKRWRRLLCGTRCGISCCCAARCWPATLACPEARVPGFGLCTSWLLRHRQPTSVLCCCRCLCAAGRA